MKDNKKERHEEKKYYSNAMGTGWCVDCGTLMAIPGEKMSEIPVCDRCKGKKKG